MIDEEITLNGVKYIRKDAVKNDDILELKSIVASILSETQENVDKIIDSYIKNEAQVPENHIEKVTKKYYNIDIMPNAQVLYNEFIVHHDKTMSIDGEKTFFTWDDIVHICGNITDFTNKDIKAMSKKFNVSLQDVQRLFFNISRGFFTKRSKAKTDDDIFQPNNSMKIEYAINSMKPTGELTNRNGKLKLNIQQVLKIKTRVVDKEVTVGRAKQIASDIGITYHTLQRVAYNLQIGVFDKYIDEWNARLSQPVLQAKTPIKMPVQNNPEKRAEMGYYGY